MADEDTAESVDGSSRWSRHPCQVPTGWLCRIETGLSSDEPCPWHITRARPKGEPEMGGAPDQARTRIASRVTSGRPVVPATTIFTVCVPTDGHTRDQTTRCGIVEAYRRSTVATAFPST